MNFGGQDTDKPERKRGFRFRRHKSQAAMAAIQLPESGTDIQTLALTHQAILEKTVPMDIGRQLKSLEKQFQAVYTSIAKRVEAGSKGTRAEEWLLDNRHVVQETLELVFEGLPKGYVRQLPKIELADGSHDMRIRQLAVKLAMDGTQPLDVHRITQWVAEYQNTTFLTTGELWALPALLRLVLLQGLAQSAEDALCSTEAEVEGTAGIGDGVEVASAIISLRSLLTHDWRHFVERLSQVEHCLEKDPAGFFKAMDFVTRDAYRNTVETLARTSVHAEHEVAAKAVELSSGQASDCRQHHVGYYLIDEGRRQLEQVLGCRRGLRQRGARLLTTHTNTLYFGLLSLFALPILVGVVTQLASVAAPPGQLIIIALILSVPILGIALALLNGLITHLLRPHSLPKLDFQNGIPDACRTAVVVPVLLADEQEVKHILSNLEINYLNNEDDNLFYVVLSDFTDAPQEHCDGDEAVLEAAERGVQTLNRRYANATGAGPFLLLHRQRRWNASECCWMGWERKRGKLIEFNRILAGEQTTSYSHYYGACDMLQSIRYVITLDADTHMPPGTARRLVGAIAHPLNQAVVDPATRQVVAGYGFMQPRVEIDPTGVMQTPFTRICSGENTIDLYTHAVSDAYQDMFGEGIFAGKGIYDPCVFEQTLAGKIPDNSLLSHDLLEGSLGRVALLSDTSLFEDYPPNIFSYMRRAHRWIRGDWQLLPWLRRQVMVADGSRVSNPLSMIHQWKIIDNLRRSLEAPCLLALLVLAWSGWLPGEPWGWTLAVLALSATPLWVELLSLLWQVGADLRHVDRQIQGAHIYLGQRMLHWLHWLMFLPYESWYVVDAITRSLYRVCVSHRRLLEWTTAAHVDRSMGSGLSMFRVWSEMWPSPVLALGLILTLWLWMPSSLIVATPILVAWFCAPQVAYLTSRSDRFIQADRSKVTEEQRRELRLLARRTWFFFQQFMGPDDHWLPPDNYQEEPRAVLARRTSPTNIGLGLLAVLSAFDFGYIDIAGLLSRLGHSFDRMRALERYRGHFLNWYETRELHPLLPRYVSTVDSGNLAGSLLTLARGLQDLLDQPMGGQSVVAGILDTLAVLEETLLAGYQGKTVAETQAIRKHIQQLHEDIEQQAANEHWWRVIDEIYEQRVPALRADILKLIEVDADSYSAEALARIRQWLDEVNHQAIIARRYQESLQPWQRLLEKTPAVYLANGPQSAPLMDMYQELEQHLCSPLSLRSLPDVCHTADALLTKMESTLADAGTSAQQETAQAWNSQLREALQSASTNARGYISELQVLAAKADQWVQEMDFGFLYEESRQLFHIGYNVTDGSLDPNYYDLLASEARLAGFVAIAKGDVPAKHWLHMERPFRSIKGKVVLMSWGATLFEYLMPRLMMAIPANSLLDMACRNAIDVHCQFTARMKLPWGISESGYYELDSHQHYQYRAFGAPGLGFRRDAGDRIVISPYSSVMALPFAADRVIQNLQEIRSLYGMGQYGLFEALDFGRTAKSSPRRARIVRSYMSHHQGMIMLALNNYLNADPMPRRFHSDARVSGLTPLLHEQMPAHPPALKPWTRPEHTRSFRPVISLESWSVNLKATHPQYNLLSNGHYSVIQAARGGGGSRWQNLLLTRWRADPTQDEWGHWIYVQDLDNQHSFSLGMDPCGGDVQRCATSFGPQQTEYHRRQEDLFCRLRTGLASQQDIEARRLTIKNESGRARRLLLGSYAEVVLATEQEDQRHPAFAKLFVESRYLADDQIMLYRRRPRSAEEKPVYLAHTVFVQPGVEHRLAWETDRGRFLGRGGMASRPQALRDGLKGFSGSTGAVLDPVIATGLELHLAPQQEVEIVYLTGVSKSRRALHSVMRSYRSLPRVQWIFEQARMQSEQELANLRISPSDVSWMMALLSALLTPDKRRRASAQMLRNSHHLQSALWGRGISGDNPILLLLLQTAQDMAIAESVLQAHAFCCGRGINIDLVIIDEESSGYMQAARDRLQQLIGEVRGRSHRKIDGEVCVLPGKEISSEERMRLLAAALVVLDSAQGSIGAQLAGSSVLPAQLPSFVPVRGIDYEPQRTPPLIRPRDLHFDNGIGGFSNDGRDYVIHLEPGQRPPAPWSNVIANPRFGCLVTESGSACTWSANSGEHRLTPWHNDPIADPSGEVLYLRDEETAEVWSPTPAPRPSESAYQVRHGAGYSEYLHHSHGLKQNWRVYVDRDSPVKIGRLTLTNCWSHPRRITATYYLEWVLGLTRAQTKPYIVSDYDARSGTLLARNAFTRNPQPGVAFLTASLPPHGLTSDRTEFLGCGGSLSSPAAMFRIGLSGKVENGGDHCAAYQVHIDLAPDETQQVYFVIGEGKDRAAALDLAEKFSDPQRAEASAQAVEEFWEDHLGRVQIKTPDKAMDLMVNRWLPYQTLVCRLWGRSGLYQSSGAFGFRDQLQDVLALLWSRPEWARAHILKAASRQFQDGDVLHWWHEKPLRGVRTRCSDDLLWLAFVTASYIRHTGDSGILRESIPYLCGPVLEKDENEHYAEFETSEEWGSLYEHCCRAIERAGAVGPHGLPVIGNGDWNDGFNRISTTGRGESVWLAWFLIRVCRDFAPLAEQSGDVALAGHYLALADNLQQQVEASGWDGAWYRRAYYDDGTPVGSAQNEECKIDLIPQAWSVLSTDTPTPRAHQAMKAVYRHLVNTYQGQILLLTPPFDKAAKDPGYIKGYPPGIRENGGQYTHAATWAVWAAAGLGDGERAHALFRMLNPVLHTSNEEGIQRYRTEPYVLAGDVYSMSPHTGRGGWSWYTGASGWLYRAALEAMLGLSLHGDRLQVKPCLPASWDAVSVRLCHGRSVYEIEIENDATAAKGGIKLFLDDALIEGADIPLVDDGGSHRLRVLFNGQPTGIQPTPAKS